MWRPEKSKLIKILLHERGEMAETPFAEDLGPVEGRPGARRVRLANVPFLHAKPTYEDEIVVEPDAEGRLAWDAGDPDAPPEKLIDRLEHDSGRWAIILDYFVEGDVAATFNAFGVAAQRAGFAVEGCFGPEGSAPGRVYLAVPLEHTLETVIDYLTAQHLPMTLKIVHPLAG